jgi:hypothetical protein
VKDRVPQFSEVDLNPNPSGIVLRLLNQVKHTAKSFADTYNLDFENLENFLNENESKIQPILESLIAHPGIDLRVLFKPEVAEKIQMITNRESNVVAMSAEDSMLSARIFNRGPSKSGKTPFYKYFDTAVIPSSPFRPELIEQLKFFDGESDLESCYFNNGHFEDQLTLYLGNVNLHWMELNNGQKIFKASRFNTSYKLPFVPHSFTSRTHAIGRILAVTYLGPIASKSFQDLIQNNSLDELCQILENYQATEEPNQPIVFTAGMKPKLKNLSEGFKSTVLLGGVHGQPSSTITLLQFPSETETALLPTANHQWFFNCSDVSIKASWDYSDFDFTPNSSIAVSPQTRITVSNTSFNKAEIVSFAARSGEGDPMLQAKRILTAAGPSAISRMQHETVQWFN